MLRSVRFPIVRRDMATHLPVIGGHAARVRQDPPDRQLEGRPGDHARRVPDVHRLHDLGALQGEHYYADPYLSPFYSPVLFTTRTWARSTRRGASEHHAWFGTWPTWWPALRARRRRRSSSSCSRAASASLATTTARRTTARSPARRRAARSARSPASASTTARRTLLLFQNLHRYALYFALAFIFLLGYDAVDRVLARRQARHRRRHASSSRSTSILIAGYTFGCHSFRHLIGGRNDCMSHCGKPTRRSPARGRRRAGSTRATCSSRG